VRGQSLLAEVVLDVERPLCLVVEEALEPPADQWNANLDPAFNMVWQSAEFAIARRSTPKPSREPGRKTVVVDSSWPNSSSLLNCVECKRIMRDQREVEWAGCEPEVVFDPTKPGLGREYRYPNEGAPFHAVIRAGEQANRSGADIELTAEPLIDCRRNRPE
jgi:hypothetical protein